MHAFHIAAIAGECGEILGGEFRNLITGGGPADHLRHRAVLDGEGENPVVHVNDIGLRIHGVRIQYEAHHFIRLYFRIREYIEHQAVAAVGFVKPAILLHECRPG